MIYLIYLEAQTSTLYDSVTLILATPSFEPKTPQRRIIVVICAAKVRTTRVIKDLEIRDFKFESDKHAL